MIPNFAIMSIANKIRTKLLLFVDKEIQSKIKQKKLIYNSQHELLTDTILYSSTDKTYSYKQNTFFISSPKYEEKNSRNEKKPKKNRQTSLESNSTCLASPTTEGTLFQKGYLKNIPFCYGSPTCKVNLPNYFFSYNNIINIKENLYSIKKVHKLSSTFRIYKRPKTDIKYLKNLCNSFKLTKKNNLVFNRQLKSKLSSVVNHINRRESSPIKKVKKKQSCRVKESKNNLNF